MSYLRRWFLILSALVLGGGQLVAAGTREERAYAAALAAFRDQFYDRATNGLTQFLQNYHKSGNAPQAVLLLAQSEFYLGNYPAAIARLTDPGNLARAKAAGLTDRYVYWKAEAQFAGGDLKGAAGTFISLVDDFPESPLGLSALVEGAAAFGKLGQWAQVDDLLENTNSLYQRTARLDPANELVTNGRLLQSESKCVQKDFAAASRMLHLLNPATLTPEQDWQRALQLYRASLGLNDLDAALTATTNLLQTARHGQGGHWAANLAESVARHADVLEKEGRLTEAVAAWQENLTSSAPVEQQRQAVLKMAELAAAQNDLTNAEAGLEKYLAQFADSPAAETALLALGEMYLKDFAAQPAATNYLAAAQTNFDQFIGAFTNSPLAGKAFLDRGWCEWLASQTNASLADFQEAAQRLPASTDLAVAKFKAGDARFALGDFSRARQDYQAVLDDFTNLPAVGRSLGELALYQCLRANLALNDAAGANDALERILKQYPEGDLSDNAILLVAEKADDARQPAVARALLEQFEKRYPHSELLPQARMAVARTYEQEQNWPAAITNYQGWLRDFPTSNLYPQMQYALALANYHAGNEANALAQFTAFISQFPTNPLTPLAQMWVGDHFFRLGGTNFVEAERHYELIFQNFPTNELACPAQLMAGRAAMGRFSYSEASRSYLIPLINDTNCPAELWVQAHFAYSDALRQMAASDTSNTNLQLATNILSQLCPLAATNVAGALAWSEIGDCDLQLGALDAATNAYAQVLDSPAAGPDLRDRAQVGLGTVLEKKAEGLSADAQKPLLDQARENYQDVFYAETEFRNEFWTKKAGLQMLALAARTGILKGDALADFITRLKKTFPQLKDSQELKRLALQN
jgi:TolA-binding protein